MVLRSEGRGRVARRRSTLSWGGVDQVNPPQKNTQKSLYFLISLSQFFFFIICI